MANAQSDLILQHIRKLVGPPSPQEASRGGQAHPRHRPEGMTDRGLLARFALHHDQIAFETLVGRHGSMVLRLCQRVLHNPQDAEDVFQATFLILARQAASRRWRDSVAGWLYNVAYHLALNARTAAARRSAREKAAPARSPTDPLAEITGRELLAVLDEELTRLPKKYRAPLVLCHLEGHTRDEAAQQLGCPLGTLKSRLERGRELLRQALAHRGLTLSAALFAGLLSQSVSPAAVPATLVRATVQGALALLSAKATTGVISTPVAALVRTWLRGIFITKVKLTMIVLIFGVAMAGTGLLAQRALAPKDNQPTAEGERQTLAKVSDQPRTVKEIQARTDIYGDPLPDGALARLGTVRFRHPNGANSLVLSPDGRSLATGSSDIVRVWDTATGKQRSAFTRRERIGGFFAGKELLAFSADSRHLFGAADDGLVLVWDLASGGAQEIALGDRGTVDSVHLSPDGRRLAAGTERGVLVRDQASGAILFELENPPHIARGETDRLFLLGGYSLAVFAPDDQVLAVHISGDPETVRLCDPKTGQERRRLKLKARLVRLAFSPDSRHIAVTERDNAVRLYEAATGRRLREWIVKLDNPVENYTSVVAFAPDGKSLAAGATDNQIHLWDVATGREVQTFRGHTWYVTGLAFAPDGKSLYSTSWDGTVRLWQVASGKELHVADGYSGGLEIAFASDSKRLATTADGAEVHIWDAVKGRRVRVLEGDPEGSSSVAFSPDGHILASGGCGLTVWLWDAATGQPIRHWSWPKGKEPYNCPGRLVFSPNGRTLATVEFRANRVQLWEVQSGKRLALINHEMVDGVAFSPDGRTLVTGGWDQALRLWDLPSGKLRKTYSLPGKPDPHIETYRDPRIEYVVYSPDGRLLATWQLDGSIRLWDAASGKVISQFKAAQGQGPALAFSPDGLWLACVGEDNTVWVCEPRSGQVVLRLAGHQGSVCSLTYSPDGRALVSGSRDNTGLVWSLRPPLPPTAKDLDTLWHDLAAANAAAAYRAVWQMAEMPDQAIGFLWQRLKAIQAAPEDTTGPLVTDLDSDSFQRREEAAKRLRELGEAAEPALRKAMEARPSLEQKRRLEALLIALEDARALTSGEAVRQHRAVAVLQRIGIPKSRELLEQLAGGLSSAPLTQQAKAALARIK